jgi:hypothetical protein
VIKSHVLYHLSYALAQGRCVGGTRVRVNSAHKSRLIGSIFGFRQEWLGLSKASRCKRRGMDGNGAWRSKSRNRTNHPDKAKAAREGQPAFYTIRIFIPHHTTASAIMKQVAVKAFSKADEAIAMLSFAYPGEVSMRFRLGPATSRSEM